MVPPSDVASPEAAEARGEGGEGSEGGEGGGKGPSFEHALERLEAIVDRLERGELPLEEALAVFEEGVALSRRCAETLEDAERRIEVLAGEDGTTRPFEVPEDADG